ncbi:hypothetical protein LTS10_010565 [Elasticomyces elasticus]|nr:hypothetical protein LTS10_010565 [Elasticomyces elasticus]
MKHIYGFTVELMHGDLCYDEHRVVDASKDLGYWHEDSRLDGKCNTPMSRAATTRKLDSDQDETFTVRLKLKKGFTFYSANAIHIAVRTGHNERQCKATDFIILRRVGNPKAGMPVGFSTYPNPGGGYYAPPGSIAVFATRGKVPESVIRRVKNGHEGVADPSSKEMAEFSPIRGVNGKTQCLEFQIRPKGFDFNPMASNVQLKCGDSVAESTGIGAARQTTEEPADMEIVDTASKIELNPLAADDGTETALPSGSSQHSLGAQKQDGSQRPPSDTVQEGSATSYTAGKRARILSSESIRPEPTRSAYIHQQDARYTILPVQGLEMKTLSSKPAKTPVYGFTSLCTVDPSAQQSTQVAFPASSAYGGLFEIRTRLLETAKPGYAANTLSTVAPPLERSPQANIPAPPARQEPIKEPIRVGLEETQQKQLPLEQHVDIDFTLSDDEDIVVIKQVLGAAHICKRQTVALEEDVADANAELEAQKRVMALKKQKIDMEKQRIELEMEEIEFERKMREREREKKRKTVVVKLEN